MRKLRFGRTNVFVSAVGFGTWPHAGPKEIEGRALGWTGHDDQLARKALIKASELGINHWDTADVYGDGQAETLIGSVWKKGFRDSIFLASKVGWDAGPYDHYYHPKQMRQQLEQSLKKLDTEFIDLYYLHHCNFGSQDEYLDDAIAMMRRFRDEGKIRFIGLSDWDCNRIMRHIDLIDPDVVQPYRNVLNDSYDSSGLKKWVQEHDLGVAFFSPLRHGLLLGKYQEPPRLGPGDMRSQIPEFQDPTFLAKMRANRERLLSRFSNHPQPLLYALLGALLTDVKNAVVLLGLRNPAQVEAASCVGDPLNSEEAAWVERLYKDNNSSTEAENE